MAAKTDQLQIRIAPAQKAALKRLARLAGVDVSTYVLERVLPAAAGRFTTLVAGLADGDNRRFVLAELHDFLAACPPGAFGAATRTVDLAPLTELDRNYLAAMVDHAAIKLGVEAPRWVTAVAALEEPWFATSLRSLRDHLLRSSPVAFKRRNLFIDSSVGTRV